jgi:hypothetical protein
MVETFGYATSWLQHACFPASALRGARLAQQRGRSAHLQHTGGVRGRAAAQAERSDQRDGGAARGERTLRRRGVSAAVSVSCVNPAGHGLVANGVYYGPACVTNPPCGGEAMSLVPALGKAGAAEAAASTAVGCGAMLEARTTQRLRQTNGSTCVSNL